MAVRCVCRCILLCCGTELPQAPAPPIAEVEPDPDPLEEEAPPVAGLEAVPLLSRRSTRPHRPPERYEGRSVVIVIDYYQQTMGLQ